MKKHLSFIIAALVVVGVLVAAWFSGTPKGAETFPDKEIETASEESDNLYEEEPIIKEAEKSESAQEKEEIVTQEKTEPENTVSLTVDCSDILSNMDSLKKEKQGLVPENGIVFSVSDIEITEGESVFDVLKRALTSSGVHLEFNLAPVTNSAYIEGIGNIYEFDCGERSGWKYSVNGEYPRVGCSDYKVNPGDKIVFIYKITAY